MKFFSLAILICVFDPQAFGLRIRCPPNAYYTNCLSNCPLTCANRKQLVACTKECRIGGCQCYSGFMLDNFGNCVRENECPKCEIQCAENAHYTECLNNCPLTCANRLEKFSCIQFCSTAGCQCNPGFLMDHFGNCVTEDNCPKPLICKVNETLNTCGNGCGIRNEQTCESLIWNWPASIRENFTDFMCPTICKELCECSKGFYRSMDGRCVTLREC